MSDDIEAEAITDDADLEDALRRVSERTLADGKTAIEWVGWHYRKRENIAACEFATPTGEIVVFDLPWPRRDDPSEFEFCRLCEHAGLPLEAATTVRDEDVSIPVPATYDADADEWALATPIPRRRRLEYWVDGVGERVSEWREANEVRAVMIGVGVTFPIAIPLLWWMTDALEEDHAEDILFGYIIFSMMWLLLVGLVAAGLNGAGVF